ncbi:DUF2844 domain-containing protein [Paraburkholderia sediminicola]|uniref:DUF2844 domain-containing protein n=1 Tax=Paraburkholderia sediminicola TaxID=458836 RepID=UPI0038B9132B
MRILKIAMLAATLLPLGSYAALGGAPSMDASAPTMMLRSVAPDTTSAAAYTVRASQTTYGITVREYVLPTNVVFAVTWDGPVRPDMNALLGSYFPNFVSSGNGHPRGTGALIERNGDFQIESAGRAGHFFGKALLPRLMPANVHIEDLQ